MNKILSLLFFYFLTTFLLLSCKNNKNSTSIVDPTTTITDTSSFLREIIHTSKLLNLPQIQGHDDSLAIRVWFNYGLSSTHRVLLLNYKNQEWTAAICYYELNLNENPDQNSLKRSQLDSLIPVRGWPFFNQQFNMIKDSIDLSESDKTKHAELFQLDGDICGIELAIYDEYAFLIYPYISFDSVPGNKRDSIFKLIDLVQKEFISQGPKRILK